MAVSRSRGTGQSDDQPPKDFPQVTPQLTPMMDHSFTLQTIMELQKALSEVGVKVDRLLDDRKEDRTFYRDETKELKNDFKTGLDELKQEFKDFRTEDFKGVKDEVVKLKLKWAWVTGIAAAVGAVASLLIEFAKKYI